MMLKWHPLSVLVSPSLPKSYRNLQFKQKLAHKNNETEVAKKKLLEVMACFRRGTKAIHPPPKTCSQEVFPHQSRPSTERPLSGIKLVLLFMHKHQVEANLESRACKSTSRTQSKIKPNPQPSQVGIPSSKHLLLWLRTRRLHQMQCPQPLLEYLRAPAPRYRAQEAVQLCIRTKFTTRMRTLERSTWRRIGRGRRVTNTAHRTSYSSLPARRTSITIDRILTM